MYEYKKNLNSKITIIFIILVLVIIFLMAKISYIKFVKGEDYEQRAREAQFRSFDREIIAKRGIIKDRNGNDIVISKKSYDVILDSNIFRDKYNEEETNSRLLDLSGVIGVDVNILKDKANKNSNYERVSLDISIEDRDKIKELGIKGVWFENRYTREYLYDRFASHILGYVNENSGDKWGIERSYDKYLSGTNGRTLSMFGEEDYLLQKTIDEEDGKNVYLTIDKNIQHFAEKAIENAIERLNAKRISVVAMEPNTGEILALASYPNFNPNEPTNLTKKVVLEDGTEIEEKMNVNEMFATWKNPVITDTYEPGSTFKIVLAAAALEEKIVDPDDTFYCSGSKTVYDREISCWKESGHGEQTLKEALMNSCNVAMMDIVEKMGKSTFYKYQRGFGFGYKTNVDLPGEESSINLLHKEKNLKPVELATASFGQRFNVTMIQMVNSIAAVINGGELLEPHIVSKVVDSKGNIVFENNKSVVRKLISEETSETIKSYMESVVTEGTGKQAYIDGYRVGGKTATSEKGTTEEEIYTLSFVGFAPVDNPKIIVLAFVDEAEGKENQGGGTAAGPIVKDIIEKTLEYYGVPKSKTRKSYNDNEMMKFTNYKDQSVEKVIEILKKMEIEYKVIGSGDTIVNQYPKEGQEVPKGTEIFLYTK
ncbi:MAG: penicillin-binding transpeptidase domain-containing protein [Clostridia bacterium]|jgi:stage V sporulation protein D (sporulation-specific penicillin-binding protein)|nr:penicillin-binding transpeptidase domain-containing protein [Clostridia bacterium]